MIQLAEEVFATKNDPDQLDVDEKVIARLQELHPSAVSEFDDGNGPVVWILMIPTSLDLMNTFLGRKITEQELFDLTHPGMTYEAIYLCSAMVLKEYRRKGIAKQLAIKAIEAIKSEHPIKTLFVWPFSREGDALAEVIAAQTTLPLQKR